MVIKTSINVKRPNITSKRPGGLIYETVKYGLQELGYYNQIRQYDPGFYFDRYSYKPRKRIAGYVGQKLWSKKIRYAAGNQFDQKRCDRQRGNWYNTCHNQSSKSSFKSG